MLMTPSPSGFGVTVGFINASGRNKFTKANCLEPEALADFWRPYRLAPQAQTVLSILPLA